MAYLTDQLDLLKTSVIKAADPHYIKAVNLRVRELRVLRAVKEIPGITATELKLKLALDKTLLSKNLACLEERGLIRRTVDTNDSRVQLLSLTRKGERTWEKSERTAMSLEAQMFSQLSTPELDQLKHLLDRAYVSFQVWKRQSGKIKSIP